MWDSTFTFLATFVVVMLASLIGFWWMVTAIVGCIVLAAVKGRLDGIKKGREVNAPSE